MLLGSLLYHWLPYAAVVCVCIELPPHSVRAEVTPDLLTAAQIHRVQLRSGLESGLILK